MSGLLRNKAAALKGGGARLIGYQIKRDTAGTGYVAISGTDCLGATAGTYHEFGSIETMDLPRDDQGHFTLSPTLIEWDTARRNLLIKAAPITATSLSKKEELDMEDGEIIESADTTGEDTTLPYWVLFYRGAPLADGTEVVFTCISQLKRSGGPSATKSGSFTKPKISFVTIDGGGYTPVQPTAAGPDAWVDGITPVALSGVDAHGVWIEATA
jgi:hypothetical protein